MHPVEFETAFSQLAPAGYYIALRLGFYAPTEERNTFASHWIEFYTQGGLAPFDPLMRWCQGNAGVARWSVVAEAGAQNDPHKVFEAYRAFGLAYGAVVSIPRSAKRPKRSFGLFAREDREMTDGELTALLDAMTALHHEAELMLTEAQAEALRLLSQGRRHKEIAQILGISISAVKARLKSAALRLEARTPVEAASIAAAKGLL